MYLVVIPDEEEPLKDKGDEDIVSQKGVPDVMIGEKVQIVYNGTNETENGLELDIVYAIYTEAELKELEDR